MSDLSDLFKSIAESSHNSFKVGYEEGYKKGFVDGKLAELERIEKITKGIKESQNAKAE